MKGEPTMPQSIVQPLRRWDPERIGPYTIIGKLGAGAMGQVFLARSTAGRLVAVKTIRIDLAEEAGFRARFAREVAAASRVSGVFTAAVIEADPEADLPWVATAYIPAPSLSTLVKRAGPLPVSAVRWLAAGCAEALQSIHGAGLLHRDVKPSNVLVAPDGPRVIDFGIARAAERVQLTATRGASGTPAYMAPEQARDATQASPASDVFSLGATLVFASTGHAPYGGETVMDILVRLATEPPDLTGMPEELTDLVARCLERVPRDRPTDATILGVLGSFAAPAGPGHSYLPDAAMTVIAEYQRPPLIPARTDDADAAADYGGSATAGSSVHAAGGDATAGSHTPLPGFHSLSRHGVIDHGAIDHSAIDHNADQGQAARRRRTPDAEPGPRPATRMILPWWARVAAAAVLLGAGIGLGMELHGSGAQAAGSSTGAASTSTGTSSTGTARTASNTTLGPVAAPPPCTPHQPGTTPELCLSMPYGDGHTVFIIHGSGFQPSATITVQLIGEGIPPDHLVTSPDHPVTDMRGTFNYAVDQGHRFFSGPIPPGIYHVLASAPGEGSAGATFRINPPGGGGQPPVP
jgi:Protein kinase domain